jgi:hypothetical protein
VIIWLADLQITPGGSNPVRDTGSLRPWIGGKILKVGELEAEWKYFPGV